MFKALEVNNRFNGKLDVITLYRYSGYHSHKSIRGEVRLEVFIRSDKVDEQVFFMPLLLTYVYCFG